MASVPTINERRRSRRHEVAFSAAVVAADGNDVSNRVGASVINVSSDGLCLKTQFETSVDSLISIVIDFQEHDSLLLAQVMWRKTDGNSFQYGMKIKGWSYLDFSLEQALQTLCEQRFDIFPHRFGNSFLAFSSWMDSIALV